MEGTKYVIGALVILLIVSVAFNFGITGKLIGTGNIDLYTEPSSLTYAPITINPSICAAVGQKAENYGYKCCNGLILEDGICKAIRTMKFVGGVQLVWVNNLITTYALPAAQCKKACGWYRQGW